MSEFDAQLITPAWGTRAIVLLYIEGWFTYRTTRGSRMLSRALSRFRSATAPYLQASCLFATLRPFHHFWIWGYLPRAMLRSSTKPLRSICEQNTCQYISPHRRGTAASDKGKRFEFVPQ